MAAVIGSAAGAAAQTPTLGALAKKEEDRRKALKAPVKVLTDDDLPKRATPPPPAPSQAAGAAKPAQDEAKTEQKPGEPEKDEAWWKARTSQVREELRRNEMFAEALQTRINALTNDAAARDDPFQRARLSEERLKAIAEMDRVKAEIELQKQKLSDIEEEARRAGVPPGWVR